MSFGIRGRRPRMNGGTCRLCKKFSISDHCLHLTCVVGGKEE